MVNKLFFKGLLLFCFNICIIGWSGSPPVVSGPSRPSDPPSSQANSISIIRPPSGTVLPYSFSNRYTQVKKVKPNAFFEHTLDGDWDEVIAHVGFTFHGEDQQDYFISIIGLGTYPEGNGLYSTDEWDRKAFWIDAGDGVPMHLAAEFVGEFYTDETDTETVFIYQNLNVLYRQQGKDYSNTDLNGEWIYMEIITDPSNNYIDHEIVFFDENDEEIGTSKLQVGDQIQTWTASFDFNEPDIYWLQTMEVDFRPITQEPSIFYKHLTPNVDFPNAYTEGRIDFSDIDLQLSLLGVKGDVNTGETTYFYSDAKNIGFKWGLNPATSVINWIYHFFE